MVKMILRHLNLISAGIIIVGILLANEIFYQLILLFRASFLRDIIHFARMIGWFFAPVAVFMWMGDVARWIEQHLTLHE